MIELILNKVSTIKIVGFRPFQSIVIASGEAWALAKFISPEYLEDGLVFINNKYLFNNYLSEQDSLTSKILAFRKVDLHASFNYGLEEYHAPFERLVRTGELLQFYLQDEDTGYVGQVRKVNKKSCRIRLLSTKGAWLKEFNFEYKSMRNFQIKGNYLESLTILLNSIETDG